jgi:hypothetical protein
MVLVHTKCTFPFSALTDIRICKKAEKVTWQNVVEINLKNGGE